MLKLASDNFDKVIVIINATNAIEMDFLDDPDFEVDAVLWVGYTGTWGLNAVADILVGEVSPSGHLVDTFCYDNTTAPSMVGIYGSQYANYVAEGDLRWYQVAGGALDGNHRYITYEEGIYVGYRYYETGYEDVVMGQGNASGYDYAHRGLPLRPWPELGTAGAACQETAPEGGICMRRADRERDRAFAYDVIDRCEYGTAAFSTGGDVPYCIPLSLVRIGDDLFFHCALQGRKLELLRADPCVCVSFVTGTKPAYVASKNDYTAFFQSAVVTGTAFEVSDPAQKTAVLRRCAKSCCRSIWTGSTRLWPEVCPSPPSGGSTWRPRWARRRKKADGRPADRRA